MKPKVGLLGRGHVGTALKNGLVNAGYECRNCGREPDKAKEIATWADLLFLAVPFSARHDAVDAVRDAARGKPLVDVTNAVASPDYELEIDPTEESGAEELQRTHGDLRVVKAFNTVFADHMATGQVKGERLTLFVAGDDADAKNAVRDLGRDLGFDPVDAGSLRNARWMETLGYFNIQLGTRQDLGRDIGFKLVH